LSLKRHIHTLLTSKTYFTSCEKGIRTPLKRHDLSPNSMAYRTKTFNIIQSWHHHPHTQIKFSKSMTCFLKWLTTYAVDIYALSLAEVNIAKAAASECLSLLGVCVSMYPWQRDNPLHWAPWGWKRQHNKQWEPFTSHFSRVQNAAAG